MYRYRRSACRAVTRHDDDDDRRAPVSTFFIVSSSQSSSPLFVVGRSRGHRDLIDLSSHLRSPVFFYVRFTANARALNSPPPPSSTHHLLRLSYLRDVLQRTADQKRSAPCIAPYTTLEGPTPERVLFTRQEIGSPLAGTFPRRSSCGLCRTTDITDGMRERTHALPSISSSRFRELSLFVPRGRTEKKRRNARRFVCTALATLGCRGPANKRKRERKRVREGEKEREDVN